MCKPLLVENSSPHLSFGSFGLFSLFLPTYFLSFGRQIQGVEAEMMAAWAGEVDQGCTSISFHPFRLFYYKFSPTAVLLVFCSVSDCDLYLAFEHFFWFLSHSLICCGFHLPDHKLSDLLPNTRDPQAGSRHTHTGQVQSKRGFLSCNLHLIDKPDYSTSRAPRPTYQRIICQLLSGSV